METINKGTPLEANNKFLLDFSNTDLIYQINSSTTDEYHIATVNCNLVVANDHGDLLGDIKELSTKSQLLLEKRPAYQFDLSLLRLPFYFPGMKHEVDELYFLSYQENIDLYSWKYQFYDIKDSQVKSCKFISLYMLFKNKSFEFQDVKKTKKYVIIDDQNENIVCNLNWNRYPFDFDAVYRDQNLIFVFDHSTFLTSDILIKPATIVNNEYLRYGKNFDINAFFTDWLVSKKREWSSY